MDMNAFFSLPRLWAIFLKYRNFYFDGLANTIILSLLAVLFGSLLGFMFAFGRMSKIKPINWICSAYITIVQSTPLLVQVMIIYYGALALKLKIPGNATATSFLWGMVAVALNSGGYMGEVIRSGIGAVDGGQMEAARAIGMRKGTAMINVVLPQAMRNILPALGNEFATVIKETSVLSMCSVADIMFRANDVASITWKYVDCYIIAAIMYFIVVFPLSQLMKYIERRMSRSVTR
ncbi:MAG: amino acid ABC transporter permease [Oscillospiraceae bacterium]